MTEYEYREKRYNLHMQQIACRCAMANHTMDLRYALLLVGWILYLTGLVMSYNRSHTPWFSTVSLWMMCLAAVYFVFWGILFLLSYIEGRRQRIKLSNLDRQLRELDEQCRDSSS